MQYRYRDVSLGRRLTRVSPELTDELPLPPHGSYGGLLFDARWREKRAKILERDGGRCVICSGTDELHVHHRQYHFDKAKGAYKVPWDYADHLLITLCKSCHGRGHSKFKIPILTL